MNCPCLMLMMMVCAVGTESRSKRKYGTGQQFLLMTIKKSKRSHHPIWDLWLAHELVHDCNNCPSYMALFDVDDDILRFGKLNYSVTIPYCCTAFDMFDSAYF